ncbi:hypothetical protein DFP93_104191 [Aneurinibacillus soli]|uniref:Uncharacterized protein n=1 Tax=Aneurinibacillus soli TaxID=1500254 RepID=A0A0U5B1D0_9BACL|nr:hypothetical protein [Aneurinibacillus soli]PYE62541.1 hypothetical protein DFP93_104191 [Aneurinibacillus soli]BAU27103.1 hypothetical protein CB4_01272 [Aneurinibacillus soli]
MTFLNQVVNDFQRKQFTKVQMNELMFYAQFRNDPKKLCHLIGRAIASNGKTQSHQKRIKRETKDNLEQHLLTIYPLIPSLKDFDELRELITIKGIGDLTVYDTADRIGYAFGLHPEKVYIHRGAKTGAKNLLGRKAVRGRKFLYIHELPVEFQNLTPREAENCLCIYKDSFLTGKLPKPKKSCNGKLPKVKEAC